MKPLRIVSFTVASLAFIFLSIGCIAPDWVVLEFELGNVEVRSETGLFYVRRCVKLTGETTYKCTCGQVEIVDTALDSFGLNTSVAVKILMIFGWISCFIGSIVSLKFRKELLTRNTDVISASSWICSAILVLMAVGLQADENLKHGITIDLKFGLPWAIIMAGIGALLAFVDIILTIMMYCKSPNKEPVIGEWNQFKSMAI